MMFLLTTISEALLYTCFALLLGNYIFSLIPSDLKPEIVVPRKYKLIAVVGIALFSFIPILSIVSYLLEDYNLPYVLKTLFLSFEVGKAWLMTFILCVILGLYILLFDHKKKSIYPLIGSFFVFLLMIGVGWTSHAHSVYGLQGLITHTVHFATVVIWVGILFVVSWFSKNKENWLSFLGWFHVTAIFSFAIIVITGLSLMNFAMDWKVYPSTWMIPYGQSLLIKHLLILPLIGYAFINGVLMKSKLRKDSNMDPRAWTKLEFFIILLIFAATGALSQQSPPHIVDSLLSTDTMIQFFSIFGLEQPIQSVFSVQFVLGLNGILLMILAGLFFVLSVFSFIRKMPPLFSFIMSVLAVFSGYIALMLSIQFV
ncbi:CopD family protein [Psychrobacillus sp. FSL H8-0484]|uniref:copper resistance D family protein n=1 Tax=Psychrobacillus sp. FSL H8-0484 TaxID=2921390 RepID=UPI0030FAB203